MAALSGRKIKHLLGWTGEASKLHMTAGKTLTIDNSLEFAGTDSTVMTFPSTSDTVVTLAATQTLTNKTISGAINSNTKVSTAQTDTITTVLANITGLTGQTLVAGATYKFRCVLPGTADGTSGISYGFKYTTATLTSLMSSATTYVAAASATPAAVTSTTDQALLADKAAAVLLTVIEGTMVVNAGGTVALQVGTHTGTTTASVYAGATMTFDRIA